MSQLQIKESVKYITYNSCAISVMLTFNIKFKFSLSADLITSYYHYVVALFTTLIIIINNIIFSVNYNYSSIKNVVSAVNKLKMTTKILYC